MSCVAISLNSRTVIQHTFLRRRASISDKSFALVSSANLCAPCVGFSLSLRLDVKHNFVPALVVMFSLLSMRISWLKTFLVREFRCFIKFFVVVCFSQLHPVFSGGAYSISVFKEAVVLPMFRFARAGNFVVLLAFISHTCNLLWSLQL